MPWNRPSTPPPLHPSIPLLSLLSQVDIDKLRAAGESAAGAMEAGAAASAAASSRNKDPGEIFGRVMRSSKNGPAGTPMGSASAGGATGEGQVRRSGVEWGGQVRLRAGAKGGWGSAGRGGTGVLQVAMTVGALVEGR